MSDEQATIDQEVSRLRARIAALEQLQQAHDRELAEQAERLEASLR